MQERPTSLRMCFRTLKTNRDAFAEADRIDAEGARWAAQLQADLERARQSVAAMQQASAVVRGATGWAGSYGVRISGSPGYDHVERARQYLLLGDYLAAQQAASEARRIAEQSIAAAQARVAQLRREEEERREAECRRRRAQEQAEEARRRRARSSSSSGGGFSSRRSSSSGGGFSSSRSSGSRRSSFVVLLRLRREPLWMVVLQDSRTG